MIIGDSKRGFLGKRKGEGKKALIRNQEDTYPTQYSVVRGLWEKK